MELELLTSLGAGAVGGGGAFGTWLYIVRTDLSRHKNRFEKVIDKIKEDHSKLKDEMHEKEIKFTECIGKLDNKIGKVENKIDKILVLMEKNGH